jgi:hypothetical protein
MINDHEERPKYYTFPVAFKTEKERDDFKHYVHLRKQSFGVPIHVTSMEMLEMHKEKYQKKKE